MRLIIEKVRSLLSPVVPEPAVDTVPLRPGKKPYPENFLILPDASRQTGRFPQNAPGELNDDAVRTMDPRICFTAGTLVKTPDGLRKIEEIKVGDLVMTVDPETGRMFPARVTETFVHDVNNVYRLTYADGGEIETTWNHPFYLRGKGWTEARYLRPGSESVAVNAAPQWRVMPAAYTQPVNPMDVYGGMRVADARRVFTSSIVKVYNIEVEGTHTYLVGEKGVLVHNYVVHAGEGPQSVANNLRGGDQTIATMREKMMVKTADGRIMSVQERELNGGFMPGDDVIDPVKALPVQTLADGIEATTGFVSGIGQRFGNWWAGSGFNTDANVIRTADETQGVAAGLRAVERLGYGEALNSDQRQIIEQNDRMTSDRRNAMSGCGPRCIGPTGNFNPDAMTPTERSRYDAATQGLMAQELDHSVAALASWRGRTDIPITPYSQMLLADQFPPGFRLDQVRLNSDSLLGSAAKFFGWGESYFAFGDTIHAQRKDPTKIDQFSIDELTLLTHETTHLVQEQDAWLGRPGFLVRYGVQYKGGGGADDYGLGRFGPDSRTMLNNPGQYIYGHENDLLYGGSNGTRIITYDNWADIQADLAKRRLLQMKDDYALPLNK